MCSLPEPVPSLVLASPPGAPFAWLLLLAIPLALAQRYFWYVRKVPGRWNQWRLMRLYLVGVLIVAAGGMLLLGVEWPWATAVGRWKAHALIQAQTPCALAAVNAAATRAQVLELVLMLISWGCLILGGVLGIRATLKSQVPPHTAEGAHGERIGVL